MKRFSKTVSAITAWPWACGLCWGSLLAGPRCKFQALGGFDERFVRWGGEDPDMGERLVRGAGCRLYALPEAFVYHLDHLPRDPNPDIGHETLAQVRRHFTPIRNGGPMQPVAPRAPEAAPEPEALAGRAARPRVSLCLIVKDEEANLPACLITAGDLVDEIIVVDTGSRDGTRDVARQLGARVFEFAWADDFAAARNESLRHASGDWIFWLDADEWLDSDNRQRLRNLFAGLQPEMAAFVMKQRSVQGPAGGSVLMVDQVRLFPSHPEVRWQYRVHEQILPAACRLGGTIRWTHVVIDHRGYEDAELGRQKMERNLRLLRLQNAEHAGDPWTLFNLGAIYVELGRTAEAFHILERTLRRAQPDAPFVPKLYALLGKAHKDLGRHDLALATYRASRARFPDDAELLFQEALLLCEVGDLAGAERCLVRLLSIEAGPSFAGVDAGLRGYKAHYQLGLVYHQQGRADLAEEQWRAAVQDRIDYAPGWLGLGELYLSQGRWPELEGVAQHLAANPQGSTQVAVLRARKHVALKEFTAALQLLEEAIARSPDAVWPREVLSYALLQEGRDWAAAEQALRAVLAMAPEHREARHNLGLLLQQQAGACAG